MKKILMALMVLSFGTAWAGGNLIVNEYQADPDATNGDANGDGTSSTTEDEFVELYNDTGVDLDVTGWTLADGNSVRHTFPANSIIPANCALVVFSGGTPTGVFGNALVQTASTGSIGLNNGGDSIIVNDGISDVVNFSYGSEGGNNQALTRDPDVTGVTLVEHSTATGSGGALFSPGTQIDGTAFSGCPVVSDTPPAVDSTVPTDAATAISINTQISINFDEPVDATAAAVTVTCDAVNQPISGLPASGNSLLLTPDAPLPFDASCDVTVLAAEVTDQDGTPDNMAADFDFNFAVESEAQSQIDLILNEFQADPDATNGDANGDGTVDTSEDEFVEIYNNGPNAVDISGWTVADGFGVRHTFAPGTTLGTCEALVIFGGGTPTGSFGGAQVLVADSGSLGLNNSNDSITLNDGSNDRISVAYGTASTNQSYTLDPDITGGSYVEHSTATGSSGALYSPGTQINGNPFTPCGGALPPRVDSTIPVAGASGVALDSNIEINFSEAVDATANAATLDCGTGAVSFAGLPISNASQLIINPDQDLPNGQVCTLTLVATEITDLDDTPDQLDGNGDGTAGDDFVMQFTAGTPEVEIFEIQGTGLVTPFNGQTVTTLDNIVTALSTNGFYMQTPDVRDDADPLTSNGIFVFTGGAPTVAVGDQVDVTGDITEFFDLTEFTNPGSLVVQVDSSGNPLPLAIQLNDTFPYTDPTVSPCVDPVLGYECVEGMYFEMPQGFISAASVGFFGSDRDDVWVKAGSERAFREPGIDYPGEPGLPEFDGNPELIEMSVDALTLPLVALSAGSEISAKGVISFGFGDYELQPSELTVINENVIPSSLPAPANNVMTLASANLFRLFNDVDDPGSEDDDQIADPMEYADRLLKLGKYFVDDLNSPHIIALQEIENLSVMNDLATAIANAGGPVYTAALTEGNDQGGIDVAYLYQSPTVSNVQITQLGALELNPYDGSLLHDRPPLRLEADVDTAAGSFSLNTLVVHMRSRGGIDDAVDGDRVRNKRLSQANSVANMADSILQEDPTKPLFILGDFNAFQFTDGYVDVIGQITGEAVAADNMLWTPPLLAATPLTQAVATVVADQQYSFVFQGSAQVLDNALMNDAGLLVLDAMHFVRGQADASVQFEDDAMTTLRSTDHDGFVLYLIDESDLIFADGFE